MEQAAEGKKDGKVIKTYHDAQLFNSKRANNRLIRTFKGAATGLIDKALTSPFIGKDMLNEL